MPLELDMIECRVLGVIIEKSLTQPGSYPLTMNAITLACNQKQNRDPVMELEEGHVSAALYHLERMRLVAQAEPAIGARVNRFRHTVLERTGWDRREQAVMAELMLRGRQTAGELRTRAARMAPIHDLQSVNMILKELAERDPPCVRELPREPGRSVTRFEHTLFRQGGGGQSGSGQGGTGQEEAAGPVSDGPAAPPVVQEQLGLRERVSLLEERIALLEHTVEALQRAGTGHQAGGGHPSSAHHERRP